MAKSRSRTVTRVRRRVSSLLGCISRFQVARPILGNVDYRSAAVVSGEVHFCRNYKTWHERNKETYEASQQSASPGFVYGSAPLRYWEKNPVDLA